MKTLTQLMDLSGRAALITGGAGHIGLAAGEALTEMGAIVAVADQNPDACAERAARLSQTGPGRAWPLTVNLANEHATRAAVREAITEMGGLNILVHCATYTDADAPGWSVPFAQQTPDAWVKAMRVDLTPILALIQEAQSALARGGDGSVILFSSIYGLVGPDMRLYAGTAMTNEAGYGASKAGQIQMARYLAATLAPSIRVNAISPGGVWRGQPEPFVREYERRTPLGRMAAEQDLKGAVAFLASDLSAYVTGHNLVVDGGWTAW